MATVLTRITIQCKNRREYKLVGVHLRGCQTHLNTCGREHSFEFDANPLLLRYSGSFHEQVFDEWDKQFPKNKDA